MLEPLLAAIRDAVLPLPPVCLWCGAADCRPLCPACHAAMMGAPGRRCCRCRRLLPWAPELDGSPRCRPCRVFPPAFAGVTALGPYQGLGRWTILTIKGRGERALVGVLGELLARRLEADAVIVDAVVPAVTDRRRARRRGFDLAVELAGHLARHLNRPLWADALTRRRPTGAQSSLSGVARRRNVRGAFAVPGPWRRNLGGRRVLLVDDVVSTGSTLDAAARALLAGGACGVWVAVLADNGLPRRRWDAAIG